MAGKLSILYQDEDLVAINKDHGLLVHRSSIAADASEFALQLLRDQLGGHYLYPVHRLDRKTSGVLLFAKNKTTATLLHDIWHSPAVHKTYHAIVRGWLSGQGLIDYPVKNERGNAKAAQTRYQCLDQYEIPLAHRGHPTSRYSLIELQPLTGRWHQIRQHMNHLRHPILGDRPHGCNKQNRLWKAHYQMTTMLLHASELSLALPQRPPITISAAPSSEWQRVMTVLTQKEESIS